MLKTISKKTISFYEGCSFSEGCSYVGTVFFKGLKDLRVQSGFLQWNLNWWPTEVNQVENKIS